MYSSDKARNIVLNLRSVRSAASLLSAVENDVQSRPRHTVSWLRLDRALSLELRVDDDGY